MITQNAITAATFLGSLGVNVHLEYTDGGYANAAGVIADLKYLGVNTVRDGSLYSGNQGQSAYGAVADAGVKFDMVVFGFELERHLSELGAFVASHPGAVVAVEGPNEVNNWPVSYNGVSGVAGAQAFQQALYNGVHADSRLANLPVYNLTSWPDIAGKADYANFHSYPGAGDQPLARLTADLTSQQGHFYFRQRLGARHGHRLRRQRRSRRARHFSVQGCRLCGDPEGLRIQCDRQFHHRRFHHPDRRPRQGLGRRRARLSPLGYRRESPAATGPPSFATPAARAWLLTGCLAPMHP
jgi:hypothetical protein